jgi:hypothetical protein
MKANSSTITCVNADWFVNRFGEIQTNTYIGTSVVTQNAGTALVHGPELEVTAEPATVSRCSATDR